MADHLVARRIERIGVAVLALAGGPRLEFIDEAALLAAADDPEREYIERVLPVKLQRAAEYAERATLWTDLAVLCRTGLRLARLA